jgi:hypothetical protein
MVFDTSIDGGLDGTFYLNDVRKDGLDAHLFKSVKCSLAHTSRYKDLAVIDSREHTLVFLPGMSAESSTTWVIPMLKITFQTFTLEVSVTRFLSALA